MRSPGHCRLCRADDLPVAAALGICGPCLREKPELAIPLVRRAHRELREAEGLPPVPPGNPSGVSCGICRHRCGLGPGQRGYCDVRWMDEGGLGGADARRGTLSAYYDPLPTNCVADWVCPGGTGAGYPDFSPVAGPEMGYKNLAVFYHGCTFDCIYCQNAQHRSLARSSKWVSAEDLADWVDERTTCVCFFGGDPAPQAPHALRAARLALRKAAGRPLRVCWETNGSESPPILRSMLRVSGATGGLIKVDCKAWSRGIHEALCGVGPEGTLESIREAARWARGRPDPPMLVVSTLLVPGYVDRVEVQGIARFLAGLDPRIPYALLGFHPQFHASDLPLTSLRHAEACLEVAREAGLERVRLGNVHLLGGGGS